MLQRQYATISGVHVFPGSAETLVRRGGITNHHLIALSTTYLPKLPKSVDVRWSYSVQYQCRFLRHSVVWPDARILAHWVLKVFATTISSHWPDACWSRTPGHPCYSWVQQIGGGTPLTLRRQWKRELVHGHGRPLIWASTAYVLQ